MIPHGLLSYRGFAILICSFLHEVCHNAEIVQRPGPQNVNFEPHISVLTRCSTERRELDNILPDSISSFKVPVVVKKEVLGLVSHRPAFALSWETYHLVNEGAVEQRRQYQLRGSHLSSTVRRSEL